MKRYQDTLLALVPRSQPAPSCRSGPQPARVRLCSLLVVRLWTKAARSGRVCARGQASGEASEDSTAPAPAVGPDTLHLLVRLSLCLCRAVVYRAVSISRYLFRCVYLAVSFYLAVIYLAVSIWLCLCRAVSIYLVVLSLYLSRCVYHAVCQSPCLSRYVYLVVSISLCLSR